MQRYKHFPWCNSSKEQKPRRELQAEYRQGVVVDVEVGREEAREFEALESLRHPGVVVAQQRAADGWLLSVRNMERRDKMA